MGGEQPIGSGEVVLQGVEPGEVVVEGGVDGVRGGGDSCFGVLDPVHFSRRKVALGTCDRPYGTPCQHESACVRCPMLRLDLTQEPRLLEIEANTRERLG
ncbi:hypothetical protein [Kitasatospora purpeofusca]|uniref:hypothetical protein n=1 Tax=Kitasatospora purpeofusca TaxID=67352 RepID=UPI0035D6A0ED